MSTRKETAADHDGFDNGEYDPETLAKIKAGPGSGPFIAANRAKVRGLKSHIEAVVSSKNATEN